MKKYAAAVLVSALGLASIPVQAGVVDKVGDESIKNCENEAIISQIQSLANNVNNLSEEEIENSLLALYEDLDEQYGYEVDDDIEDAIDLALGESKEYQSKYEELEALLNQIEKKEAAENGKALSDADKSEIKSLEEQASILEDQLESIELDIEEKVINQFEEEFDADDALKDQPYLKGQKKTAQQT